MFVARSPGLWAGDRVPAQFLHPELRCARPRVPIEPGRRHPSAQPERSINATAQLPVVRGAQRFPATLAAPLAPSLSFCRISTICSSFPYNTYNTHFRSKERGPASPPAPFSSLTGLFLASLIGQERRLLARRRSP